MGVRQALFPVLTLGALTGVVLPASRRYSPRQAEFIRPRSRAVQQPGFAESSELLSEAFQLASTDGCATGLPTRSRHVCDCSPRLALLAQGRPQLLTVRWPQATGLAS